MKLELSAPNWRYYFNVAFRSPRPGLKAHRLTPPPRPACLLHPRATSGPGVAGCHLERSMSLFPFLVRVAPTALSVWAGELRGPPRAAGGLLPPSPHPTPRTGGARLWPGHASGDSDLAPSARMLPRDPGTPGPARGAERAVPATPHSKRRGPGLLLVLPFCASPRPAPPKNFRAQPLTLAFVPGLAWVGRLSI